MKKVISYILIITILISFPCVLATPSFAAQSRYYSDVYTNDSYYNATNYLYEHAIMLGDSATTFSPNKQLTRGQMVVILWRMLSQPTPKGTIHSFIDCPSNQYYYSAVLWASSSGVAIVNGYEDNSFRPNQAITQQEAFIILYRFACHCGYDSGSSATQNMYINALNSSSLTYKNSFASWGKAGAGWAVTNGFIINNNVKPNGICPRKDIAQYVYKMYQKYQKKYGLVVAKEMMYEGDPIDYSIKCGKAMQTLFMHYGANSTAFCHGITKDEFSRKMRTAFYNAKALDVCYLYCVGHGNKTGIDLFTSIGSVYLTPAYLRSEIDLYDGTFVVLLSACNSGTFISKGAIFQNQNDEENGFDANAFVAKLTGTDPTDVTKSNSDLQQSYRIKVICSSRKNELSYESWDYITKYWCLGAGYDCKNERFTTKRADTNYDGRVTHDELYNYSYKMILNDTEDFSVIQHVVCFPNSDSFVYFEEGY